MAFQALIDAARAWYAIELTSDQATKFAQATRRLAQYSDARMGNDPNAGMDTADRDLLAQRIVEDVLGPGNQWPINGDGAADFEEFSHKFAAAAPAKGYKLTKGIWPDVPAPGVSPVVEVPVEPIEDLITAMKLHYNATLALKKQIGQRYRDSLEQSLPIGAVVDITKVGPAHRASTVLGRSYGHLRQITSKISVDVDLSHPSLSRWTCKAISLRVNGSSMGTEFSMRGMVAGWFGHIPSDAEMKDIIAEAGGLKL